MRDKNRIKRITDLLAEIWSKHYDLRFFQLIINLPIGYKGDLFYYEDDDFEAFLLKYLEELKNESN